MLTLLRGEVYCDSNDNDEHNAQNHEQDPVLNDSEMHKIDHKFKNNCDLLLH